LDSPRYRLKIEKELSSICDDILHVLDDFLIPSSTSNESKVCFRVPILGDLHLLAVSTVLRSDASLLFSPALRFSTIR
jgi:hypothetical protein